MSQIFVAKGTSGTGKGTRMVQLIEFLKKEGYVFEELKMAKPSGKTTEVGIGFPSLDLCFVGLYVKSNKSRLWSWSSMDAIHSAFGGSEGANQVVRTLKEQYGRICLEGEPMMLSNRWRPEFLRNEMGFDEMSILYYVYPLDGREAYDQRIIGRSGSKAGDSGWSRNESYHNEYKKSLGEKEPHERVLEFDFDSPLSSLGGEILCTSGLAHLYDKYIEFCETNPMLRSIQDKTSPIKPPKKSNSLW